ncbi:MAG TPA: TIGR01777 family oxidoreductase [Puia sp.]|nr:TIGR01777 family oxidoreductase [Puia sp.]
MPTILITGGTGLIGTALTKMLLKKNYEVIILTRSMDTGHQASEINHVRYAHWDIKNQTVDTSAIREADYIVHLAGAAVADKRWTADRKKEISESRIKSSELIIKSLKETPNKVKAVISTSAIGWYGPDNSSKNIFKENDKANDDFLGETCRHWEESINPVTAMHIRLVKIRTGIVLSSEGGALKEFMKPLRSGIAAILGNGRQMVSWIHIDDVCRIYVEAIENEKLSGVYNAVAPKPVSNKALVVALAKRMKGKFYIPVYVPSVILKFILGEMSIEVLKSATVSADKIRTTGFQFLYPGIESALNELVKK